MKGSRNKLRILLLATGGVLLLACSGTALANPPWAPPPPPYAWGPMPGAYGSQVAQQGQGQLGGGTGFSFRFCGSSSSRNQAPMGYGPPPPWRPYWGGGRY